MQDVKLTYVRNSENVYDVFCTSYVPFVAYVKTETLKQDVKYVQS